MGNILLKILLPSVEWYGSHIGVKEKKLYISETAQQNKFKLDICHQLCMGYIG